MTLVAGLPVAALADGGSFPVDGSNVHRNMSKKKHKGLRTR